MITRLADTWLISPTRNTDAVLEQHFLERHLAVAVHAAAAGPGI